MGGGEAGGRAGDGGYIRFDGVTREYGSGAVAVRALDGITFGLEEGAFNVIVGPSGAGKTTVLNLLGGMDAATAGSVYVDGRDIARLGKRDRCLYRRNEVGFVFQFYNLIQNLTALENVELASHIKKDSLPPADALRDVGLGGRVGHFPSQLSGGEQQRVAIARALAKAPKLLLCDEPTGALDYVTGKGILRLLRESCEMRGVTVVLITHNTAITPMADRVVRIKNGRVEAVADNASPVPISEIEW
ncbi:MAG: ABC transporter ATP-binding protein [Oscillospiraceae bacterium]|nr:ABC transporter ATP-binding protein [Oscillospiraceae bacterium]